MDLRLPLPLPLRLRLRRSRGRAVAAATARPVQAAHGATARATVRFAGGPVLGSAGDSALVGEEFRGGGRRNGLLINLSGQAVTIPATGLFPANAGYHQVTGSPIRQYATAAGLRTTSGVTGSALTLPAYSLTLVTVR